MSFSITKADYGELYRQHSQTSVQPKAHYERKAVFL
jgi:hypothetical protein